VQHFDFSLVELVRAEQPTLPVRPVMLVRHPVDLFFSEYLYKKHCLWRQQGRSAPGSDAPRSLPHHIARLRASRERRAPLATFLAGSSWCSCATDREARRAMPSANLRARALANAATYMLVGTLERVGPSMELLGSLLGLNGSALLPRDGQHTNTNAFERCVDRSALPEADQPTPSQRAEVAALLAEDVASSEGRPTVVNLVGAR
jgi:hypothetical protein